MCIYGYAFLVMLLFIFVLLSCSSTIDLITLWHTFHLQFHNRCEHYLMYWTYWHLLTVVHPNKNELCPTDKMYKIRLFTKFHTNTLCPKFLDSENFCSLEMWWSWISASFRLFSSSDGESNYWGLHGHWNSIKFMHAINIIHILIIYTYPNGISKWPKWVLWEKSFKYIRVHAPCSLSGNLTTIGALLLKILMKIHL